MKNLKLVLILFACISIFATCKKEHEDALPPATQVGAGTFGCKINGKVYVPKGSSGTGTPNPHVIYDIGLNGNPYLFIETHQFLNQSSNSGIDISFFDIISIGEYHFNDEFRLSVGSQSILGNCGILAVDTTIKRWGGGAITKLDITNRIISGNFNCKFKRPQCDTIYITDGRFDIKF